MAENLEFRFWTEASAQDFSEWQALPVFQQWSGARNRMSGTVLGLPVEMVDYTYVVRSSEGDSSHDQTLALFSVDDTELPAFELRPRTLGIRMMSLIGAEGIVFSAEDVSARDEQVIERFNKNYHLSSGLEAEAAKLVRRESPASADADAAIRRLFSLDVLAFFADHSAWCVQGIGRRLAVWQTNKIVAPADRPRFLAEAFAIRAALVDSAQGAVPSVSVPAKPRSGPEAARARLTGTMIGGVSGFFLGGILGAIVAGGILFRFADPHGGHFFRLFFLEAVVFFGGTFGGLVLGMFVGRRVLAGPIERALRHRQERLFTERKDCP
jgi:hypothetical protein